jgi:hypothetical protein
MRTSSEWLLIPSFTEFGTLGLLALQGCRKAADRAIISKRKNIVGRKSMDFERFQSGDVAIGF